VTRAKSVSAAGDPPPDAPHNDNIPFDAKAWRRKYMRKYMAERRERMKAAKAEK
jgi:hypothetical protein